jgi:RNA polymerase sigma-70 factor, ECF subfamily
MRQLSPDDYKSEFDNNYAYYRQQIERGLAKQVYDRRRFDDLCQDTFLKALRSFARPGAKLPQTDDHLGNLLADIAVQVAIDDYRKNKKSKDYLLLSESVDELCVEEDFADRICDKHRLREVIAQLPPMERVCLVLKYYYGYTQKKIAAKLDISEPMVSMYVKSGETELRKKTFAVTVSIQQELFTACDDLFENIARARNTMDIYVKYKSRGELALSSEQTLMEDAVNGLINSLKLLHDIEVKAGRNLKPFKADEIAKYFPGLKILP